MDIKTWKWLCNLCNSSLYVTGPLMKSPKISLFKPLDRLPATYIKGIKSFFYELKTDTALICHADRM